MRSRAKLDLGATEDAFLTPLQAGIAQPTLKKASSDNAVQPPAAPVTPKPRTGALLPQLLWRVRLPVKEKKRKQSAGQRWSVAHNCCYKAEKARKELEYARAKFLVEGSLPTARAASATGPAQTTSRQATCNASRGLTFHLPRDTHTYRPFDEETDAFVKVHRASAPGALPCPHPAEAHCRSPAAPSTPAQQDNAQPAWVDVVKGPDMEQLVTARWALQPQAFASSKTPLELEIASALSARPGPPSAPPLPW